MIKIKNLTKIYNYNKPSELKALDDFSLDINDGEFIAIMGRSGSGKTTLINILSGLNIATSGSIVYDDFDLTKGKESDIAKFRNENIGIVFQKYHLINEVSVMDNVLLPVTFTKMKYKEKIQQAKEMLSKIGIDDCNKKVSDFSGGEQQRIVIIRALMNDPKYIIADEPTGALDTKNATKIMEMFLELKKNNKTIIMVTHDNEIAKYADRIINISDGKLVD